MNIQTRSRASKIPAMGLSALVAGLLLTTVVVAWGSRRYDGVENFALRIAAEVEARRSHPEFAPTPWAVAPDPAGMARPWGESPGGRVFAAASLPASLASSPTPNPSPAPSATPVAKITALPASTLPRGTTAPARSATTGGGREQRAASAIRPQAARPTPGAAHTPASTSAPDTDLPVRTQIEGLRHNWQTWNNCGPATIAMQLSYFGSRLSQADVAATLRPYRDDKNVSPEEMAAFARDQGMHALVRVNGDAVRLKQLLAAGLPVLIETWYEPKPNDGMGHYRLLVGYDDAAGEWIAYDSYDGRGLKKGDPYRGIRLPYDEVARLWEVFNRTYVVLYDDARAAGVEAIVGQDAEDAAMWERALEAARVTVQAHPENVFAWFNAGSSLLALGRDDEAAWAFDRARKAGLPWRMLWYQFGPFEAYYRVGRYDEIIALADATLRNAQIEELYYWRGRAQQAKGEAAAAQASLKRALELNPNFGPAAAALGEGS